LEGSAGRGLKTSRRPFICYRPRSRFDILIHVPLRMENLGALSFDQHLHWPQGRGKPALIVLRGDETKTAIRSSSSSRPRLPTGCRSIGTNCAGHHQPAS